jgi:predicted deacylase
MTDDEPFSIAGTKIAPGEFKETSLKVSEFYTATDVQVPVFIKRGTTDGPRLFVSAAVHGDEINGVQIVRDLVHELRDRDLAGMLVGIPVVNRFGFINHDRYMPDRRDLNRSFPGDPTGSVARRYAYGLFTKILSRCTHGIDLHTAGYSRTNLPQVRGDMNHETVRTMARAFGTNVVLHNPGRKTTLRRACTDAGVPTLIYEAGETFRFQRDVVTAGKRGIINVMSKLGMIDVPIHRPDYQVIVKKSLWVRTQHGGLLDVYVNPGDLVYEGDEIGAITNPFGREVGVVRSPATGLVIGRTLLPLANPGNPICHIAKLDKTLSAVEKYLLRRTGPNMAPMPSEGTDLRDRGPSGQSGKPK